MFTDIKDYTSLMGKDEEKALQILRISRKIHKVHIDSHNGTWLKEMGDGVLAQFESARDAVLCAIAIQNDAHLQLDAQIRIGIHVGDVTIENQDIFGDGVNLASRLQSSADPGGIYISESVHKAIRAHPDIECQFLGNFRFKNVDYPVGTYAIQGGSLPPPSRASIRRLSQRKKPGRIFLLAPVLILAMAAFWYYGIYLPKASGTLIHSLAVLPFEDLTGVEDQSVYLAGMHEALISELGQIEGLRIISKTSSSRYRNTDLDIPQIAGQLGVEGIVEASVYQVDSIVKMRVNLIRAFPEEKQLWSDDITRDFSHILEVYRTVTRNIVEEIKIALQPNQEQYLQEAKIVNPEAYAAYLTARSYWGSFSPESMDKALEYYQLALQKDPDYAPAYGGIASVWAVRQQFGFTSRDEALPHIEQNLEKALALNSTLAESYYYKGLVEAWTHWNWEAAENALQNALAINPNMAEAHAYYSHLLMALKRPVEMQVHMDKALELDPFNPVIKILYGAELIMTDRPEKAIEMLTPIEKLAPNNTLVQLILWIAYTYTGELEDAFLRQKRVLELVCRNEAVIKAFEDTYRTEGYEVAIRVAADRWADLADVQFVPPDNLYWMYGLLEDREKTLEWLEIGYDTHDSNMPYTAVLSMLQFLQDDPAYLDLMDRMNLPKGLN